MKIRGMNWNDVCCLTLIWKKQVAEVTLETECGLECMLRPSDPIY